MSSCLDASVVFEHVAANALPVRGKLEAHSRLMSLWDIVQRFNLLRFADVIKTLAEAQHICHAFRLEPAGAAQVDLPWMKRIVEDVGRHCRIAGFNDSSTLAQGLARTCITPDLAVLATHLYHLQEAILTELQKHAFVSIQPDRVIYCEDNLFGKQASEAFPSAQFDIKEAGNCLALGCSTAAVFHLMRAVEWGIRALAYDRRIRLSRGPIELATWEELIRQLEDVEKAIQGYPRTLAREAQFAFYHGASMDIKRFKNKFRNAVMHTRDEYDQDQAKSAFNHVKSFMQTLAGKISETKRTPVIWKRA